MNSIDYYVNFEKRTREQLAKSNLKYRLKNKEKINQLSKDYYNQNKNNEEFKQKMRNRAKAYYEKKKKSKELLIIPDF